MLLAFLPQHAWEVAASVLAVVLVAQGLIYLLRGHGPPEAAHMSPRTVRIGACASVLAGLAVGIAAFTIDAEAPGAHNRNAWGGTTGVVLLVVWLALLGATFRRRAR